jgi:hypothetical protein
MIGRCNVVHKNKNYLYIDAVMKWNLKLCILLLYLNIGFFGLHSDDKITQFNVAPSNRACCRTASQYHNSHGPQKQTELLPTQLITQFCLAQNHDSSSSKFK